MALVTKGSEGKDDQMADDQKSAAGPDPEDREERDEVVEARGPAMVMPEHHGFMSVYKPGQGYWTRMRTAGAVGLVLVFTCIFLYSTLKARLEMSTQWA